VNGTISVRCGCGFGPAIPRSFLEVSEFEIAERTVDSCHQQIVVVDVAVSDRCNHCERDRLRVESTGGGGAADPAAAS
jgi:hypothetical protein